MKRLQAFHIIRSNPAVLALGLCGLFLLAGCASGYGSIRREATVAQQFEANQVPTGYRYFIYGFTSRPYAIAGIDPKYEMPSKLWTAVEPNTDDFKESTRWVWEDLGFTKFGADILDPKGDKIGVWYSSLRNVTVKFMAGNRIYLITDHPFMFGPLAGDDGDRSGGL